MEYPVYLLLGPEKGLKQEFIDSLKKKLGDISCSRFYAFEDYESELYSALTNLDMFCTKKLIILDEAQEIKSGKKASNLASYIRKPSHDSVLLIISPDLYINSEVMKAVPDQQNQIVKFYELFEGKKVQWLKNFFSKHNLRITDDACDTIIEKVDNDISEFKSVCSRITLFIQTQGFPDNYEITSEDVDSFLVHTRGETWFSLFSYIVSLNTEGSLACLKALLRTGENMTLMPSRISAYFRRLYSVYIRKNSGLSTDKALTTPYYSSDRPIVVPKDKNVYREALDNYSFIQIKQILALLSEYDILVKSCGVYIQQFVLEKCIIDIIVNKGRFLPKYEFASL